MVDYPEDDDDIIDNAFDLRSDMPPGIFQDTEPVDPNTIVKGCKACIFSVYEYPENKTKGFWNFCPTCGSMLEKGRIIDFHPENVDDGT